MGNVSPCLNLNLDFPEDSQIISTAYFYDCGYDEYCGYDESAGF